jgi:FkbM family methyltransferase
VDYFSISYPTPKTDSGIRRPTRTVYFPALDDHILNTIRQHGTFYENDLLEHLYRTIPHRGVFLDVGGNIGNHTVFLAAFMADHVVSFEPHPVLFDRLQGVVARNGLGNVTCVNTALGSAPREATLALPRGAEHNCGSFSLRGGSEVGNAVTVPVVRLDDLLPSMTQLAGKPITAMKIDVEGAEEEVLAGAEKTIATHRPHLLVEIQDEDRRREVAGKLARLGYKTVGQYCATPTYHFAPWSAAQFLWFRAQRKARFLLGRRYN